MSHVCSSIIGTRAITTLMTIIVIKILLLLSGMVTDGHQQLLMVTSGY